MTSPEEYFELLREEAELDDIQTNEIVAPETPVESGGARDQRAILAFEFFMFDGVADHSRATDGPRDIM